MINNPDLIERAEILWEKGTNRSQFLRGEVDKYTWIDVGSSFLPSEITAAFLLGQLERVAQINGARRQIWNRYYAGFAEAESSGLCVRPYVPAECEHNGHIFYLILHNTKERNDFLGHLKAQNIGATFHYVPLHDSPAGKQFGCTRFPMPNTDRAGHCLVRLPLFPELSDDQQERIIQTSIQFLSGQGQYKNTA